MLHAHLAARAYSELMYLGLDFKEAFGIWGGGVPTLRARSRFPSLQSRGARPRDQGFSGGETATRLDLSSSDCVPLHYAESFLLSRPSRSPGRDQVGNQSGWVTWTHPGRDRHLCRLRGRGTPLTTELLNLGAKLSMRKSAVPSVRNSVRLWRKEIVSKWGFE